MSPSEIMQRRWERLVAARTPYEDQADAFQIAGPTRQFAAEYSQIVYMKMLQDEKAVGNYFETDNGDLGFSTNARETMVQLMEELHETRGYSELTLHISVGISDRYLDYIMKKREQAPLLSHLVVTTLLMAAKLNEPCTPNFSNIVNMINGWQKDHMTIQDLVTLEEKIIKALEFDLTWPTPLHFLERYQRLFNLDDIQKA